MRLEGRSNAEIMQEVRCQKKTLWEWFSDDKVKEYMQEMAERIDTEFATQMATAGFRAVQAMVELLDMPADTPTISTHQKHEVAADLLDRFEPMATIRDKAQMKAAERETIDQAKLIQIFANMDDAHLLNFLTSGGTGQLPTELPPADA